MVKDSAMRLRKACEELGRDQKSLAAALGVSQSTLSLAVSGQRKPSRALLNRLYERFGISSDWVLYGHGEMLSPPLEAPAFKGRSVDVTPPDRSNEGHGDVRINGVEFQHIRRWDLSVNAGPGMVSVSDEVADYIAFTTGWFARHDLNPDACGLVRATGSTMAPTIPDGALVLLHRAERVIADDGIYAFALGDEIFIRRLQRIEDGFLILSDNPAHLPRTIVGREAIMIRVVGRVRAVIQEI